MESRGSTRGGGEVERVAWGAQVERVRRFRTLLVIDPKVAGCSSHTGKHSKNRSVVMRERCGRSEDRRFVLFTFSLTERPAISYAASRINRSGSYDRSGLSFVQASI